MDNIKIVRFKDCIDVICTCIFDKKDYAYDLYEPMMELIEKTIEKLILVDFEAYRIGRGIERASIDTWNGNTTVDIVYDDSHWGCYYQGK